jgi:hypothetical protein
MHVESFDSLEEMMAADNQRQLDLLPLIEPWQKELNFGDTFAVYEPSWDLWVFCRVMPVEEIWDPKYAADYLPGEMEQEKQVMLATWERGFRPCQNFSEISPEGEIQDCHVFKALLKLEPEEFECMKAINWNVKGCLEGEVRIAPEKEAQTRTVIAKLIRRVTTPGAVKHA